MNVRLVRRQRKRSEAERAGAGQAAAVVQHKGHIGHSGAHAFGQPGRMRARRAAGYHQELLTAPAHEVIAVAKHLGQTGTNLAQHRVAARMAVQVVDLFEVVDIDQEEHQIRIRRQPFAALQRAVVAAQRERHVGLDPLVEKAPVVQPGQGVGQAHFLQRGGPRADVPGEHQVARASPEQPIRQAHQQRQCHTAKPALLPPRGQHLHRDRQLVAAPDTGPVHRTDAQPIVARRQIAVTRAAQPSPGVDPLLIHTVQAVAVADAVGVAVVEHRKFDTDLALPGRQPHRLVEGPGPLPRPAHAQLRDHQRRQIGRRLERLRRHHQQALAAAKQQAAVAQGGVRAEPARAEINHAVSRVQCPQAVERRVIHMHVRPDAPAPVFEQVDAERPADHAVPFADALELRPRRPPVAAAVQAGHRRVGPQIARAIEQQADHARVAQARARRRHHCRQPITATRNVTRNATRNPK